jgi:hypothetical protein
VSAGRQQQRVAVRRRFRDGVGADVAAGAGAVLDDDGLAEMVRHLGRHDPPTVSTAPPARTERRCGWGGSGSSAHAAVGWQRDAANRAGQTERRCKAERIGVIPAWNFGLFDDLGVPIDCRLVLGVEFGGALPTGVLPGRNQPRAHLRIGQRLAAYSWMAFTTSGGVPAGANKRHPAPDLQP